MALTSFEGMVIDNYEMGEEPFVLKDAIVMPESEFFALTPEQLQAMKQERYDRWYAIVNNPDPPPLPPDPDPEPEATS